MHFFVLTIKLHLRTELTILFTIYTIFKLLLHFVLQFILNLRTNCIFVYSLYFRTAFGIYSFYC